MEQEQNVIYSYSLSEAIEDGVLRLLGWYDGKPLIATAAIARDMEASTAHDIFVDYFQWVTAVAPTLKEEDRMYVVTASNGETVWVIDDGTAITLLYPSDY